MIVGDPDICMYTCIAQQKTSYNFLTESNERQKDILEKFFHLDIIKKLKKVVDDYYKEFNIKLKALSKPSNDSTEVIIARINKNKEENIKLEKSISDAELALETLRKQKEELLSNRPILNKDLLNKDYLEKLEKYIAKHDINFTSEEELWSKVSELQLQILPVENFKSSISSSITSTINSSINKEQESNIVETITDKSTKIIDNIISSINIDITNYNSLISIANKEISKLESLIESNNNIIINNKNTDKIDDLDLVSLQSQYDSLLKSKPKAEISTAQIKNEINRITNLMKNVKGLCTDDYEPVFSTTCQCCQNNRKLFGYSNIDSLKTQLLEIDRNNESIRESNLQRESSIKKMDKLIRLKKELIDAKENIDKDKDKINKLKNNIDTIKQNIDLLNKLSNIYSSIKTARTNVKVKKMMEQLDDIKNYEKYTVNINQLEKKISNLSTHITEWRANIFHYQRTQILDENLIERTKLYELHKHDIEKEIVIYNAYKNCFNTKDGIQVKLLSLKLPILNETINHYLKSFDVDFQVSIKLDIKNNIEINLVKRGSVEPIKLTAGYQHDLINLLLRVALWKLYEGPLPNFFIFDETFSHADQTNLFKTIDFLKSLKKIDYPPQFILINSHNSDTINNLDHIFNIEHNEMGRISRLNNIDKKPFQPKSNIDELTPYGEFSEDYLNKMLKSAINDKTATKRFAPDKVTIEKNKQDKLLDIVKKKSVDINTLNTRIEENKSLYYCDILKKNIIENLTCTICNSTFKHMRYIEPHLVCKTHIYKYNKLKSSIT